MGNTHTHRGGRRAGGRHPRDAQPASRGPGASSPPAGRAPRGSWPRPTSPSSLDGSSAPQGALPSTPPAIPTTPSSPARPSNPTSYGRARPAPDPTRNGAGAGRSPEHRHPRRDPFATPPPTPGTPGGFATAAQPAWPDSGPGGRHGAHGRGALPPPPPAPLVHLNGNNGSNGAGSSNGYLALVPSPLEIPDAALAPEPSATSAPDVETWTPRTERSARAAWAEREHEPLRPGVRGEVGPLIEALHDLFERDRAVASQGTSTRCGICYLHFSRAELVYREAEGFYACPSCAQSLGSAPLNMVRRQQK